MSHAEPKRVLTDASRPGEKHAFVTGPFDFGFIQEGLDSCIVGIEYLDRVEHLYGACQNVNIDISCRINRQSRIVRRGPGNTPL